MSTSTPTRYQPDTRHRYWTSVLPSSALFKQYTKRHLLDVFNNLYFGSGYFLKQHAVQILLLWIFTGKRLWGTLMERTRKVPGGKPIWTRLIVFVYKVLLQPSSSSVGQQRDFSPPTPTPSPWGIFCFCVKTLTLNKNTFSVSLSQTFTPDLNARSFSLLHRLCCRDLFFNAAEKTELLASWDELTRDFGAIEGQNLVSWQWTLILFVNSRHKLT